MNMTLNAILADFKNDYAIAERAEEHLVRCIERHLRRTPWLPEGTPVRLVILSRSPFSQGFNIMSSTAPVVIPDSPPSSLILGAVDTEGFPAVLPAGVATWEVASGPAIISASADGTTATLTPSGTGSVVVKVSLGGLSGSTTLQVASGAPVALTISVAPPAPVSPS
jgi:hypothetical protein